MGAFVTWSATVPDVQSGNLRYRYVVRAPGEPARIVRDFSPDGNFEWSPGAREGTYNIEVYAKDVDTGSVSRTAITYPVSPLLAGQQALLTATRHPLVFWYSAPPCRVGATMTLYTTVPGGPWQSSPAKKCDGTYTMNFAVAGLRPGTVYNARHVIHDGRTVSEGPIVSLSTGQLPDGLPVHTRITGEPAASAEPVLLSASLFSRFVATDLEGNVIWYYPQDLLFLTRPEAGGRFFGIQEDWSGGPAQQIVRQFDLTGATLLETNAEQINEQLRALGKREISAFHHEARTLRNGDILVLASVEQVLSDVQGSGPVDILGDMIIVLNRDLEVVWTWDAFDHLNVTRRATLNDQCNQQTCPPYYKRASAADWLHGNSVAETPDGNLIYSARSQDWVIKIEYRGGQGSGAVLWRLGLGGDFALPGGAVSTWFSHQHDPEFESDGNLSLFDNSNVRQLADPASNSRGQVWMLDEAARVAQPVMNADLGYFSFALGSAQRLTNGNYSFDAGYQLDGTGVTLEIDGNGNTVHAMRGSAPEYRTFRMKSLYEP